MPTGTSWLTADRAKDWRDQDLATGRLGDVTREIADDPVSIVVMRGSNDLAAQTVRILEPTQRGRDAGSAGGEQSSADIIVLGTSALDIQRGDRFLIDSQLYEVIYVSPQQPSTGERTEAKAIQVQ